ncbi:MAG TPA: hypothetical protein VK644_03355 [Chitinophagaceae bacterium]|nr:hypothetical protein [Chitinophagaceae bacterium]
MATEKNKSVTGVMLPVLAFLFFLASCNDKTPPPDTGSVQIPNPQDTSALGKINHFIEKTDIENFRKEFANQRDSLSRSNPYLFIPVSETFNKQALLNLLKDSTNVGLRIYYGVKKGNNRNEVRLMLVGVNSKGEDLYYLNGGDATKIAAKLPPPLGIGGVEYGQCTPPCSIFP